MQKVLTLNEIKNKVVLLASLDWGMGHTTRCVSIIRVLLERNNTVIFAGDKKQVGFIKKDFPQLQTEKLEGYNIELDSTKNTYMQMARQQKGIMRAIKNENSWLKNYAETNKVDIVISDNRYGFYHTDIPSIIMTHQINLQVPNFKYITNWVIKRMIEKFDYCWVPDNPDRLLTGKLSDGKLKIPIFFIGPLCRFRSVQAEQKYDYLIILSGPEPERTNFLEYAKDMVLDLGVKAAFVGAEVEGADSFSYPTTDQLELLIAQSEMICSRAGYTTIMEMVGLNKKALLFQTKGQYEQEYLAQFVKHPKLSFR